jgi:hypothetical protein
VIAAATLSDSNKRLFSVMLISGMLKRKASLFREFGACASRHHDEAQPTKRSRLDPAGLDHFAFGSQ